MKLPSSKMHISYFTKHIPPANRC